jgi:putative ubiquitin-RnfH superfamily antitoxin RatB of RatAB toxin-antitoxin module
MSICVEVIFALPQRQERVALELPSESTALNAVKASGLLERLPQGKLGRVGIWGKLVPPDTILRDRDRVEIYRPMLADPKEIRRDRAVKRREQAS